MPGVDGTFSTRMIRFLEKEKAQAIHELQNGKSKPRVPIFAVSASLSEDKRFDYLQSGYISLFLVRWVRMFTNRHADSTAGFSNQLISDD
jgi:hypothetical protein